MGMKADAGQLPREPADLFTRPFYRFLRIETAAAGILLLCVALALAVANSPWSAAYLGFWSSPVGVAWGPNTLSRSLKYWIDDGAMTLFFFVVALELKREILLGELRALRTAAFSMAAAAGGMLVPALVFVAIERDGAAANGWGIVMATDTAFVIGCLAILGNRIPRALRLFLLSVAIFDDIGAIVVIAVGYGGDVDWAALGTAGALLAGIGLMNRAGIRHIAAYTGLGIAVWFAFERSGIHPTVAGIALGLMTPARPWVSDSRLRTILDRLVAAPGNGHSGDDTGERLDLRRAGVATRESLSPLERLELALHPWVAFLVLPLFALANAGFVLSPARVDMRLAAAVTFGLFLGKPLGIVGFGYLATRLRIARRPAGLSWRVLSGGAILTGIGFTMAVLIAELALDAQRLDSAKMGILCASLLSALCGLAVLAWATSARGHVSGASFAGRMS